MRFILKCFRYLSVIVEDIFVYRGEILWYWVYRWVIENW